LVTLHSLVECAYELDLRSKRVVPLAETIYGCHWLEEAFNLEKMRKGGTQGQIEETVISRKRL